MPSWNDLLDQFQQQEGDEAKTQFLRESQEQALKDISALRGNRHVLLYSSAFLQKPQVPAEHIIMTHEDLNGLMSAIYGMEWERGLTLILHTPGGQPNAAESFVAYLRSKFNGIEAIVPALAMSAGTMVSLACDRLIMGRQSQLGPIDPQLGFGGGRSVSARAVVDQFERAEKEIVDDQVPARAHVWAPILQSLGPALLQESQNALDYSESMVAGWLSQYMFANEADPVTQGGRVTAHFNDATTHKSHGRRIDRNEARQQGVLTEDLEIEQDLQEAVLTSYHLMTIMFEQSQITKLIWTDTGRTWMKNWAGAAKPSG